MNTNVIKEQPAFTLDGDSWNGAYGGIKSVSWRELRNATVGKKWDGPVPDCGRDEFNESAEVVYKSTEGCAILFRKWGTTDSDRPEPWECEPELVWFDFA